MRKKKLFTSMLVFAMLLSGCGNQGGNGTSNTSSAGSASQSEGATVTDAVNADEMFTDRDYRVDYDENESAVIELNGDSATCSSDAVEISGSTITITDEGTYIVRGTLDDGMIIVNAEDSDKPQIVLDGVTINSATSAPVYVLEADKVFITLAEGTTNTLSNGGSFTAIDDNNIDAVIFSKQDLTLNGEGSLTVNSPAGHGIVSKDDLVFTSGTYTVNSASHGIDANDSVRITNATITVDAGKDGIHAENSDDTSLGFVYIASGTFDISAEGDGVSAEAYMQIEDGTFNVVTGGGSENAAQQTSDAWGGFMGGQHGGQGTKPDMQQGGTSGDSSELQPGGGMGGQDGTMPEGGQGTKPDMKPDGMGGQNGAMPEGEQGAAPDTQTEGESGTETDDSTAEQDGQSEDAAEDDGSTSIKAFKATGNLTINNGTFTIDSADDAVHSNTSVAIIGGTFDIESGDDGFHADETLTVTAGNINITECYEGLEGLNIDISNGDIKIVASDDGLNAAGGTDSSGFGGHRGNDMFGGSANGSINISGGNIYINASGDGIDSNGTFDMAGGTVTISDPTQGDTSVLDYETSGTITGGTFVGTGATQMAQSLSSSEQGVIFLNVGNQSEGTVITVTDSSGNTLVTYEPDLSFALVLISTPDLVKGETYTITVGSSTQEVTAE